MNRKIKKVELDNELDQLEEDLEGDGLGVLWVIQIVGGLSVLAVTFLSLC